MHSPSKGNVGESISIQFISSDGRDKQDLTSVTHSSIGMSNSHEDSMQLIEF